MADESWARSIILQAWPDTIPRTLGAVQIAQAIARLETQYGLGWKGAMRGSMNWGALISGHHPDANGNCPPGSAAAGDHDAGGNAYTTCFATYATDVDGAAAMMRQLARRKGLPEAMAAGDAAATAHIMRATGYFAAPESQYASAIMSGAKAISSALHEPLSVSMGPSSQAYAYAAPGKSKVATVLSLVAITAGGYYIYKNWHRLENPMRIAGSATALGGLYEFLRTA